MPVKKVTSMRRELTGLNVRVAPTTDHGKEFHQKQWKLFEEEYHDAVIKIGKTEFKVSKFPFMAQSDVFKRLFAPNFKEGITSEIEVKDVDESTMKHLIKWMYIGQFEDEAPIEKLFAAAEKYDIELLKKLCIENMLDTLDAANAFQRLIIASLHNDAQLKDAALDMISGLTISDFARFFTSDEWTNFAEENKAIAKEVRKLIRDKMRK